LIYSGFCDDFFTLETPEKSTVMVRGNDCKTLCEVPSALRYD
jgi:hypothetical protein